MEDEALELHDWNAGMEDGWDDDADADPELGCDDGLLSTSASAVGGGGDRLSILPDQHAAAIEALRGGLGAGRGGVAVRGVGATGSSAPERVPLRAAGALPQSQSRTGADGRGPSKRLAVALGAGRPRALRGGLAAPRVGALGAFPPGAGTEGFENVEEGFSETVVGAGPPWVPPGVARAPAGSGARLGPRRDAVAGGASARLRDGIDARPNAARGAAGVDGDGCVSSPGAARASSGATGPELGRGRDAPLASRASPPSLASSISSSSSAPLSPEAVAAVAASRDPARSKSPSPASSIASSIASAPSVPSAVSRTPTLVLGRGAAGAGPGARRGAPADSRRRPTAAPALALPRGPDDARARVAAKGPVDGAPSRSRNDATNGAPSTEARLPPSPAVFRAADLVASPGLPSIGRRAFASRLPTPTRLTGSARRVSAQPGRAGEGARARDKARERGASGPGDGTGDGRAPADAAGPLPPTPAHLGSALKRLASRGLLGDARAATTAAGGSPNAVSHRIAAAAAGGGGGGTGGISTSVDGFAVLPLPSLPDLGDAPKEDAVGDGETGSACDGLARRLRFADPDSASPASRQPRFGTPADGDGRGDDDDDDVGGKLFFPDADLAPPRRLSFGANEEGDEEDDHACGVERERGLFDESVEAVRRGTAGAARAAGTGAAGFPSPLLAGEARRALGSPPPLRVPPALVASSRTPDLFARYAWPGATPEDLRPLPLDDSDASDDDLEALAQGRTQQAAGPSRQPSRLPDASPAPAAAELAQMASPAEALRGLQQELSEAFEREQDAQRSHDIQIDRESPPETREAFAPRIPEGTPAREAALMRRAAAAAAEGERLRGLAAGGGEAGPLALLSPAAEAPSLAGGAARGARGGPPRFASLAGADCATPLLVPNGAAATPLLVPNGAAATPLLVPNGAAATPLLAPGSFDGVDGVRRDAYGVPHETPSTVTARRHRGAGRPGAGSDGSGNRDGRAVGTALDFDLDFDLDEGRIGADESAVEGGRAPPVPPTVLVPRARPDRELVAASASASLSTPGGPPAGAIPEADAPLSPPSPSLETIDVALRGATLEDDDDRVSNAISSTAFASPSPSPPDSLALSNSAPAPVRTPSPAVSAARLAPSASATPPSPPSPSTPASEADVEVALPGTPPETPFVAPASPPPSALPGRALPRSALKPGGTLGRAARVAPDERKRQEERARRHACGSVERGEADAGQDATADRAPRVSSPGEAAAESLPRGPLRDDADSFLLVRGAGAGAPSTHRRASRATRELQALMADLELHGDPAATQLQCSVATTHAGPSPATAAAGRPGAAPILGTLPLLSPVRAPRGTAARAAAAGGRPAGALVATPVRRSARLLGDWAARPDADGTLDATGFAYAPNPNYSMVESRTERAEESPEGGFSGSMAGVSPEGGFSGSMGGAASEGLYGRSMGGAASEGLYGGSMGGASPEGACTTPPGVSSSREGSAAAADRDGSSATPSSASSAPRASPTPTFTSSRSRRQRSATPTGHARARDPELSPTEQSLRRSLRLSAKKAPKRG